MPVRPDLGKEGLGIRRATSVTTESNDRKFQPLLESTVELSPLRFLNASSKRQDSDTKVYHANDLDSII